MAWQEWWLFTRTQKTGIFILFGLMLLATGLFVASQRQRKAAYQPPAFADSLAAAQPPEAEAPERAYRAKTYQRLDINQADSAAWESLPGIGPVLARRIIRFREAIGGFDSPGQLAEVYGLPEETFERILPYLYADAARPPARRLEAPARAPKTPKPLEVNRATPEDWEQMPGIGPVLSQRIVKYRDARGGFTDIAQLAKVYGFPPETFEALKPYLLLDPPPAREERKAEWAENEAPVSASENTSAYRTRGLAPAAPAEPAAPPAAGPSFMTLELNSADSARLVEVPGIGAVLARRILSYRKILGHYVSVEQLRLVYGLSEENYQRMASWLSVSPPGSISPKDLNTASLKSLGYYLPKDVAQALYDTRQRLGRFGSWEEVQASPGLSAQHLAWLQHYFRL
jgi:DNA uptake protein ComE-like DNA-binding protein